MAEAESEAFKTGGTGAVAAGVATGSPIGAGVGGALGGIMGYAGAKARIAKEKEAQRKRDRDIAHANLYAPFFEEGQRIPSTMVEGDPTSGAVAGIIQGLEQGGKFGGMVDKYNKDNPDDKDIVTDKEPIRDEGVDDAYPRPGPNRPPVFIPPVVGADGRVIQASAPAPINKNPYAH